MRLLSKDVVPTDWDSQKIGFYVEKYIGGASLKPSDFCTNGFPVIPKKAIQAGGNLVITKPTYCSEDFAVKSFRSIADSSYSITTLRDLVPTGPTIGTVVNFDSDKKYVLSQGVYGLKFKDSISKEFFAYLSNSGFYRNVMRRIMVGSTQVHIRTPEYLALEIQLPLLPEQRKIAKILSTWDKAIVTTEKLIAASKQQKKALMQQLLTGKKRLVNPETGRVFEGEWRQGAVGDFITFSGGAQPPRSTFVDTPRAGYTRLIQIRDYKTDKFITYIPTIAVRKSCTKDDVMIGRYGPPIFQILRGIEGAYNVALIKAIPNELLNKEFMFYFLCREPLFEYIESFSRRTSGQTGIEMDRLKEYPLLLPTTEEQQKIVQVLVAADKKIELLESKLAHFQQEKKALMQQLLTGKRRVKVEEMAFS